MTSEEIAERVTSTFRELSGFTGEIKPEMSIEEIGLDSLDRVEATITVEEELDVDIDDDDLDAVRTVGEFIKVVEAAKNG